MSVPLSETVISACTACGGPNMILYPTDHGHAWWCPTVNAGMRERLGQVPATRVNEDRPESMQAQVRKTRRARVRDLSADGVSPRQIADRLGVCDDTVRADLASIRNTR